MRIKKALRQAVRPLGFGSIKNHHRPGWRFLLFTTELRVTVLRPIWNVPVNRICLIPFREVWPTACRCVQRLAFCCETGGFCIIAEISTVCKNFCSDPPDTAGGYGIRPYGVGGDARHRSGSVVTAAMCRGRTMFAPTAPPLNCIVGRGLDPSAGRCKHRPLQKRPAGIFSPAGRFS